MIKVSVVMPVYNAEDYLEETLDSILNQTLEDFELICVDDGSSDNSLNILNTFSKNDNRIKIFKQNHKGAGAARNFGLSKCNGQYVSFIDSDDLLDLNALYELYNISIEKNLDFIVFRAINFDDVSGKLIHNKLLDMDKIVDFVGEYVFDINDLTPNLFFHFNVAQWCKFYNLDFLINCNAKFAEGIIFEDNQFFWETMFNANRIYFYNKYLYKRRIHSGSVMESNDKRYVGKIIIMNIIIKLFLEYGFWEQHKNYLCNHKVSLIFYRYNMIQDEFKEYFYHEIKKDFQKLLDDSKKDEIIGMFSPKNKKLFDIIIKSNNFDEFKDLYDD